MPAPSTAFININFRALDLRAPRLRALSGEQIGLLALLLVALLARLFQLETVPGSIIADEADNLQDAIRVLSGHGPALFGLDWKPAPAFNIYLIAVSIATLGTNVLALRLPTAVLSVAGLIPMYYLARQTLSRPASFFAVGLFAFSLWYLHFSRSGWENADIVLYTMGAAWALQKGLREDRLRWFVLAGAFCALGLYGYFSGRFIVLALLAYLPFALRGQVLPRERLLRGYGVLLATTAVLFLPMLFTVVGDWARFNQRAVSAFILTNNSDAAPVALVKNTLEQLRGFVLLDPGVLHNPQYLPLGRTFLDPIAALLFLLGLIAGVVHFRRVALWWCLLVVPWFFSQVLTNGAPDAARAIGIAPVMYLLIGLLFDSLPLRRTQRDLAQLGLLALTPVMILMNLVDYSSWMGDPKAAELRHPAIDNADFGRWAALQTERARSGEPGFTVDDWQAIKRTLGPAVAANPGAGSLRVPTPVPLNGVVAATYGGPGQLLNPHGVAVDADGNVYVADTGNSRVQKFDASGKPVLAWGSKGEGEGQFQEPWAIVIDAQQTLFVLDNAVGTIQKFDVNGRFQGKIGDLGAFRPRGMSLGPNGDLVIADTGRDRILSVGRDGKLLNTIEKARANLNQPVSAVRDLENNYIVVEPDASRVQRLGPDGKPLDKWAIARSDTVNAAHLAIAPDRTLIMANPIQHRLDLFTAGGAPIGFVVTANGESLFETPVAVAVDAGGAVYVVDVARNRVVKLTLPPR